MTTHRHVAVLCAMAGLMTLAPMGCSQDPKTEQTEPSDGGDGGDSDEDGGDSDDVGTDIDAGLDAAPDGGARVCTDPVPEETMWSGTAEDFVTDLVEIACRSTYQCAPVSVEGFFTWVRYYASETECHANLRLSEFDVRLAAVAEGRSRLDVAAAGRALEAADAYACGTGVPLSLSGVFVGTGSDGAACGSDHDCAAGLGCRLTSACDGTCAPADFPDEGPGPCGACCYHEFCAAQDCLLDGDCDTGFVCEAGACVESCASSGDCAGAVQCVDRLAGLGQVCEHDPSDAPACQSRRGEGESCEFDDACEHDAGCVLGRCTARRSGTTGDPCNDDLFCGPGFLCVSGSCEALAERTAGESCDMQTEYCAPGLACQGLDPRQGLVTGACGPPPEVGDPCVLRTCPAGLWCNEGAGPGVCAAQKADGESCVRAEECVNHCVFDPQTNTAVCGPRDDCPV